MSVQRGQTVDVSTLCLPAFANSGVMGSSELQYESTTSSWLPHWCPDPGWCPGRSGCKLPNRKSRL